MELHLNTNNIEFSNCFFLSHKLFFLKPFIDEYTFPNKVSLSGNEKSLERGRYIKKNFAHKTSHQFTAANDNSQ